MPERTRLVFSQGERELSLRLANTNPHAVVVQSWVDQGDGSQAPDTVQSALFVLPAVQRLSPQAISQVRVLYTGEPLPADRESVFWLNLHEIPLLPDAPGSAPRLLLGLNTQIKVFHRPAGLADPGPQWSDALHFRLQWQAGQWILVCRNDSPYFASLPTCASATVAANWCRARPRPDGTALWRTGFRAARGRCHPAVAAAAAELPAHR
jgi:P pilus assembly chaperone PapD